VTRPIPPPVEGRRPSLKGAGERDELDALAAEWGISAQQIERVLSRRRPPLAETTAELERLLQAPPRAPTPSLAEALAGLKQLLGR
jgi:hypothetical protein